MLRFKNKKTEEVVMEMNDDGMLIKGGELYGKKEAKEEEEQGLLTKKEGDGE